MIYKAKHANPIFPIKTPAIIKRLSGFVSCRNRIQRTKEYPNATRAIPTTTLMSTYPANPQTFPPCSITNASFEKVENVVKPPQKPTVRNNAQLLPSVPFLPNTPQRRPIRKHPTRFTVNVAQGNPLLMPFRVNDTRYRPAPPRKLPAPTANMVLIRSIV